MLANKPILLQNLIINYLIEQIDLNYFYCFKFVFDLREFKHTHTHTHIIF
jgi:hypothetical protein